NLVTNRTWDDFWLNEGFTVYVESRIMERLYGAEYADMLRVLGKGELDKTLGWMMKESPDDSHLRLHLGDRDPDEGLTDIAYEKGRFFLMMLEQMYGRVAFDEFLNGHFSKYAFGTVTTDLFLADLKAFHDGQVSASFIEPAASSSKIAVAENRTMPLWANFEPLVAAWIDGPGLPSGGVGGFPELESKAFQRVEQQVSKFLVSGEPLHRGYSVPCDASVIDTTGFTTHHWLHLLRQLHTRADGSPGRLSREEMAGLDARFLKVGRRKFLMPIYEALLAQYVVRDGKYEPAFAQGKEMATEIFLQAEPGYHSVAARSLRELLGLPISGGSGR
ncbi:MAG: hypothetical protein RIR98_1039, partial [Bacteroidota bacterium]